MEQNRAKAVVLVLAICIGAVHTQKFPRFPKTKFSCQGRSSGYYADLETGCQVYHMCDGLGRQFSYACPNTTLFQQRMLICDHWYMVNCSTSEKDYSANLLIGQRDKPFVADDEDHQRTPRPDILTVPYAQGFNYFGDYSQIPTGQERSLSNVDNSINNGKNDISDDRSIFAGSNHWSTELNRNSYTTAKPIAKKAASSFTGRPIIVTGPSSPDVDSTVAYTTVKSQIQPRFQPSGSDSLRVGTPSKFFEPPKFLLNALQQQNKVQQSRSSSTTVRSIASFNNQLLGGGSSSQEQETKFINRFDPNEFFANTEAQTTEESQSSRSYEIQTSSETARFVPVVQNKIPNQPTKTQTSTNSNSAKQTTSQQAQGKILNNPQTTTEAVSENENNFNTISQDRDNAFHLDLNLLPPKFEYSEIASTTMGPPIYYEWKWAPPAFDQEPPNLPNEQQTPITSPGTKEGRPAFALPRTTTQRPTTTQRSPSDQNTSEGTDNFKLAPYFIPDYVFPLDKQHPGYEEDGAMTSFQVRIPQSIVNDGTNHPYYGENAQCPQCHPSFVVPGTCKPCVMIRR